MEDDEQRRAVTELYVNTVGTSTDGGTEDRGSSRHVGSITATAGTCEHSDGLDEASREEGTLAKHPQLMLRTC